MDGGGGVARTFSQKRPRREEGGHRRQPSQLSRSSVLAEPIPEELVKSSAQVQFDSPEIHITPADGTSSHTHIKPFSPLLIRKRSPVGDSLAVIPSQQVIQPRTHSYEPGLTNTDGHSDWESVQEVHTIKLVKFCREAISELQKR